MTIASIRSAEDRRCAEWVLTGRELVPGTRSTTPTLSACRSHAGWAEGARPLPRDLRECRRGEFRRGNARPGTSSAQSAGGLMTRSACGRVLPALRPDWPKHASAPARQRAGVHAYPSPTLPPWGSRPGRPRPLRACGDDSASPRLYHSVLCVLEIERLLKSIDTPFLGHHRSSFLRTSGRFDHFPGELEFFWTQDAVLVVVGRNEHVRKLAVLRRLFRGYDLISIRIDIGETCPAGARRAYE